MISLTLLIGYLSASSFLAFLVRRRFAWAQRLNDCNWQAWVLLDIIAAFLVFSPLYLINVIPYRPPAGMTTSCFLGRLAWLGPPPRWVIVATHIINAVFFILTSQKDHCARAAATFPG